MAEGGRANTTPTLLTRLASFTLPLPDNVGIQGFFFLAILVTYERGKHRETFHAERAFLLQRHPGKSKAGIYRGDMVAFHSVCVCCFKAQAAMEAERQHVGFALMVHIKYF